MYHDRTMPQKTYTAVEPNNKFLTLLNKKARKSHWLVGVSPLALAACGGGGDTESSVAVVTGTSGADTFANAAADQRFEGGLGDDVYNVSLSGSDTVLDTGGNDTIKIVWRDEANVRQVEEVYVQGEDLVFDMIGAANVIVLEGAFADETRIENVQYYHAAGNWGDDYVAKIFKFGEEISADGTTDNLIVGTNEGETLSLLQGDIINASVYAAGGNDTITTGAGTQYIFGGMGNDVLDGGVGDDVINAGDGDDIVYMSPGADIEDGGDGVDTLILGDWAGNYSGTINLETGANFAAGGTDNADHKAYNFENITIQHSGDMTVYGTSGDNIITTGNGSDTVYAGAGDDVINNNTSGTDYFDGGDGIDTYATDVSITADWRLEVDLEREYSGIEGQYGADLMETIINFENATIQSGVDALIMGDEKANVLTGGTQSDEIGGRSGSDTLTGNGGADTFVFAQGETGTDTITDFDLTEGDKLDLSSYGITSETAAEAAMSDVSGSVEVAINGTIIASITGLSVAELSAADGWIA